MFTERLARFISRDGFFLAIMALGIGNALWQSRKARGIHQTLQDLAVSLGWRTAPERIVGFVGNRDLVARGEWKGRPATLRFGSAGSKWTLVMTLASPVRGRFMLEGKGHDSVFMHKFRPLGLPEVELPDPADAAMFRGWTDDPGFLQRLIALPGMRQGLTEMLGTSAGNMQATHLTLSLTSGKLTIEQRIPGPRGASTLAVLFPKQPKAAELSELAGAQWEILKLAAQVT